MLCVTRCDALDEVCVRVHVYCGGRVDWSPVSCILALVTSYHVVYQLLTGLLFEELSSDHKISNCVSNKFLKHVL